MGSPERGRRGRRHAPPAHEQATGDAPTPGAPPEARQTGTLFVVATPIGNLEDISLRALRVLREVDLVAAEDTRRTSHLLGHYGIHTRLSSLHEHNERGRIPGLLASLAAGKSIALVTDAGTPGTSDPGMLLVGAARDSGFRVEVVPGPSAVTAALSAAGRSFDGFLFVGFPPFRSKDRKWWFRRVSASDVPVVLYEAPHRIRRTLAELGDYLVDRQITVARELTKVHEEVFSGRAQELLERLAAPKGEFTLIISPAESDGTATMVQADSIDETVHAEIGQLTENDAQTRRQQLRAIADRLGVPVREVYAAAERVKNRS